MLEITVVDGHIRIAGGRESLEALGDMLCSAAKLKQRYAGTLVGHGCAPVKVVCTDRTDVYKSGEIPECGDIVKHGLFYFECIGFAAGGEKLGLRSAAGVFYVDDAFTVTLIHRPRPK